MRRIPESEYTRHLDGVLGELAGRIAASGLSISEIARETRMTRNTVTNATQGIPISVVNACRIVYFLDKYQQEHEQQIQTDPDRAATAQ